MLQLVDFVVRNRFFLVFVLLGSAQYLACRAQQYLIGEKLNFNTSNYYVAKTLAFSNSKARVHQA